VRHEARKKHECARISSDGSTGESPVWRKASHRSSTESCMWGGNELHGARRKEVAGPNASEGIEPRNV